MEKKKAQKLLEAFLQAMSVFKTFENPNNKVSTFCSFLCFFLLVELKHFKRYLQISRINLK